MSSPTAKPQLLVTFAARPEVVQCLSEPYEVHVAPTEAAREAVFGDDLLRHVVRAILTNGVTVLSAAMLDRLPNLEIIAHIGAGYEGLDVAAARARGIAITHGPGTNSVSVADHALALMLAVARALPQVDRGLRQGEWEAYRAPKPILSGHRVGIIGLGRIGQLVAERVSRGFGCPVSYHNRSPRPDADPAYRYEPDLIEMARSCDYLVATCPGGPSTFHIVNTTVLAALGPSGIFVNAARGSVVDTDALIAALSNRTIAGAGLDVFEREPDIDSELLGLPNVVLSPHVGSKSPESAKATVDLALTNLAAHFAGMGVITPIPDEPLLQ